MLTCPHYGRIVVGSEVLCEAEGAAVFTALRVARSCIAGGYSRFHCRKRSDAPLEALGPLFVGTKLIDGVVREAAMGVVVDAFDEEAAFFDFNGALMVGAVGDGNTVLVAEGFVRSFSDPTRSYDFKPEEHPLPQLLGAFDRAIARVSAALRRK